MSNLSPLSADDRRFLPTFWEGPRLEQGMWRVFTGWWREELSVSFHTREEAEKFMGECIREQFEGVWTVSDTLLLIG